jgi:Domain of unknown function (DUF4136)
MRINNLFFLVITLFAAGCHSTSKMYNSETSPGIDFSQYKTYAYLPTHDTAYTKMVNKKKLEHALATEVVKQLTKRGMTLDTLHPDCLFTYTLVMKRKYEIDQEKDVVYSPQVYDPGYGSQGYVYYFSSDNRPAVYNGKMNIDTLREGSLVIDMIDRKENKVIWRASAQATREQSSIPSLQETVKIIVPEMFSKFPKR